MIMVLNKIDKLDDRRRLDKMWDTYRNPNSNRNSGYGRCPTSPTTSPTSQVGISALKGENIQQLFLIIEGILSQGSVDIDIVLPANRMDLVNLAHGQGQVHEVKFLAKGI